MANNRIPPRGIYGATVDTEWLRQHPQEAWQWQQEQFRKAQQTEEETAMSAVAWCDPGDHPFKAGVPGSQSFDGTVINENGERVSRRMDVCPKHAFPGSPDSETTPAIETS